MDNRAQTDTIGDLGELLAQLLLTEIAFVNPYRKDRGLDFFCEMRDRPSVRFFVQSKASLTPVYTEKSVRSLPVECQTVEQYWLPSDYPVFVLMSDADRFRTYYVLVDHDTYRPEPGQKTYTFAIPLANQITRDNVGLFARVVLDNQKGIAPEELEARLLEHYGKHPELYHNLDEVDRFLEVMRGSEQEAQMEVRSILKQRVEAGAPAPRSLVEGLVSIFINCKDRITQNHVLGALVTIGERNVIPQILRQIRRNMELHEYRMLPRTMVGSGSSYTDFLFHALVQLQATGISEEMRRFLRVRDLAVNLNAMGTCARLGLHETADDIIPFLEHPDDWVRYQAAQALSQLNTAQLNEALARTLRTSQNELEIAGVIQALAEGRQDQWVQEILGFAAHSSREVRRAVALYLGAVNPVEYVSLLLQFVLDDDHKVRTAALQGLHKCLPVVYPEGLGPVPVEPVQGPTMTEEELERLALPVLQEAYANGLVLQVNALLSLCKGQLSLPTLTGIYLRETEPRRELALLGPMGEVEAYQEVHLKTAVLEILKHHDIPEICTDIIEQITQADDEVRYRYVAAAGEMRLEAAFAPITTLFERGGVKHKHILVSALANIDAERARAWAIDTLHRDPPWETSATCFDIIDHTGGLGEVSALIKESLLRFLSDSNMRRNGQIYPYVERYNVVEASPLIVAEIRGGPQLEYDMASRMLRTLAILKTPEGRDLIIEALQVEAPWTYWLLQSLASIGDIESLTALAKCKDDPDPDIRKLVQKALSKKASL